MSLLRFLKTCLVIGTMVGIYSGVMYFTHHSRAEALQQPRIYQTTLPNKETVMQTSISLMKDCNRDNLETFGYKGPRLWDSGHFDQCTLVKMYDSRHQNELPIPYMSVGNPVHLPNFIMANDSGTTPVQNKLFIFQMSVSQQNIAQIYDLTYAPPIDPESPLTEFPLSIAVPAGSIARLVFLTHNGGKTWQMMFYPGHGFGVSWMLKNR